MSVEIIPVQNGFIVRPTQTERMMVDSTASIFVFNNAEELGKHISLTMRTIADKDNK